jgi:hypothetical protein
MIECGYEPRTSFDWNEATPPEGMTPNREQAQEWLRRMEDVWDFAKNGMKRAQERQSKQVNKRRREVDFDVGDEVMITTKNWNIRRPTRKLAEQNAGPFRIIEKVGNAFKVELPDSIKVHPIFSPDKLRLARKTEPLPGQIEDPQGPIEVDGQQEWEVEKVIAVGLIRGKLFYRVEWTGHDTDLNWYPAQNFKNSPEKIRDFHHEYPELPGPPKRLEEWLKAAENDEFLEDDVDDDKPRA